MGLFERVLKLALFLLPFAAISLFVVAPQVPSFESESIIAFTLFYIMAAVLVFILIITYALGENMRQQVLETVTPIKTLMYLCLLGSILFEALLCMLLLGFYLNYVITLIIGFFSGASSKAFINQRSSGKPLFSRLRSINEKFSPRIITISAVLAIAFCLVGILLFPIAYFGAAILGGFSLGYGLIFRRQRTQF